jgi:hypothetical protein
MWSVMADLSVGAVRADAVFVSGLQRCEARAWRMTMLHLPAVSQQRAGR